MVSDIHYYIDVDSDIEARAASVVRAPAAEVFQDCVGFRGLTVVFDPERRILTTITLWSDSAARNYAMDRLTPLVEAIRLALGAREVERRDAVVIDDWRTRPPRHG